MAPRSTQTVFGFGCCLDWRPTSFVSAFPSIMVCCACGLVPREMASLPCTHWICEQCYKREGTGIKRCPLDKEIFEEKHVVWSSRIESDILRRRVRCWNVEKGCNVEGVASEMLEHFASACRFHVVSCARCRVEVLHEELADHLDFCRTPCASFEQPTRNDNTVNSTLQLNEALLRILEKCSSVETRLASLEERLSSLRDNLISQSPGSSSRTVAGAAETRRTDTRSSEDDPWQGAASSSELVVVESERSTVDDIGSEDNRMADSMGY